MPRTARARRRRHREGADPYPHAAVEQIPVVDPTSLFQAPLPIPPSDTSDADSDASEDFPNALGIREFVDAFNAADLRTLLVAAARSHPDVRQYVIDFSDKRTHGKSRLARDMKKDFSPLVRNVKNILIHRYKDTNYFARYLNAYRAVKEMAADIQEIQHSLDPLWNNQTGSDDEENWKTINVRHGIRALCKIGMAICEVRHYPWSRHLLSVLSKDSTLVDALMTILLGMSIEDRIIFVSHDDDYGLIIHTELKELVNERSHAQVFEGMDEVWKVWTGETDEDERSQKEHERRESKAAPTHAIPPTVGHNSIFQLPPGFTFSVQPMQEGQIQ